MKLLIKIRLEVTAVFVSLVFVNENDAAPNGSIRKSIHGFRAGPYAAECKKRSGRLSTSVSETCADPVEAVKEKYNRVDVDYEAKHLGILRGSFPGILMQTFGLRKLNVSWVVKALRSKPQFLRTMFEIIHFRTL